MKYSIGAKLKVVNVKHGAEVDDGEIITVIQIGDDDGYDMDCYGFISPQDGRKWYLYDDEVAPATLYDTIRGSSREDMATILSYLVTLFKNSPNLDEEIEQYLNTPLQFSHKEAIFRLPLFFIVGTYNNVIYIWGGFRMILCNKDCIPCCDFCIYSIHEEWVENGKKITGGPIGCKLHQDEYHQKMAESCGSCKDYHCFNVPLEKENDSK